MRVLLAAALALGVAGTALGQEAAKAGSKLLLDANGKVHSPGTMPKPATTTFLTLAALLLLDTGVARADDILFLGKPAAVWEKEEYAG